MEALAPFHPSFRAVPVVSLLTFNRPVFAPMSLRSVVFGTAGFDAVPAVADDGVSDSGEVRAYLMRAPRSDAHLEKGPVAAGGAAERVVRFGPFSTGRRFRCRASSFCYAEGEIDGSVRG